MNWIKGEAERKQSTQVNRGNAASVVGDGESVGNPKNATQNNQKAIESNLTVDVQSG